MSTQAIAGFNAKVLISTDGGSTYNPIAEITDLTLEIDSKTYNATSHDSAGAEENIYGNYAWKASTKHVYAFTDPQRTAIRNAIIAKTTLLLDIQPKYNTSGQERFRGSALVTKYAFNGPNENVAAVDVEFLGTGALVAATQP